MNDLCRQMDCIIMVYKQIMFTIFTWPSNFLILFCKSFLLGAIFYGGQGPIILFLSPWNYFPNDILTSLILLAKHSKMLQVLMKGNETKEVILCKLCQCFS